MRRGRPYVTAKGTPHDVAPRTKCYVCTKPIASGQLIHVDGHGKVCHAGCRVWAGQPIGMQP